MAGRRCGSCSRPSLAVADRRGSRVQRAPGSIETLSDADKVYDGLATPEPVKDWSMTTLREKLIKIAGVAARN